MPNSINSGGAVGLERYPCMSKLGVQIPAATDQPRQLHCQTLGNRCEFDGSSEMTIINGCPVSQYVWHAKEPSLLMAMSAEHRSKFAALHR